MALIISNLWWQRELDCGKHCFYAGQFERAVICFYRAAQHAESAIYLYERVDVDAKNTDLLHCAYQWLSDSFAALDDEELQNYYGDLAALSLKR